MLSVSCNKKCDKVINSSLFLLNVNDLLERINTIDLTIFQMSIFTEPTENTEKKLENI